MTGEHVRSDGASQDPWPRRDDPEQAVDPAAVHQDMAPYAGFLSAPRRARMVEPEADLWPWRGADAVRRLRARRPDSPVRVLAVHGAGAHAAALWPVASQLAERGIDVLAPDLPGYGRSPVQDRRTLRYQDWIRMLGDLVEEEDDGRPLLLLGGSLGGLLAVEVAARHEGLVGAVAATCLLDPSAPEARSRMTRWGGAGTAAMRMLPLVRGVVARRALPVSRLADLSGMGRDPALGTLCAEDPRGGGARMSLGFWRSYLEHPHEAARRVPVPVTLLQPEHDAWTPLALSTRTLGALPGPTDTVILREGGHFPVEDPALDDLVTALERMIARHAG